MKMMMVRPLLYRVLGPDCGFSVPGDLKRT